MKISKFFWITGIFVLLTFVTLALAQSGSDLTTPGMPGKMKRAIESSLKDDSFAAKTKAVIKPGEEPGYLGIAGAPKPNVIIGLLWSLCGCTLRVARFLGSSFRSNQVNTIT